MVFEPVTKNLESIIDYLTIGIGIGAWILILIVICSIIVIITVIILVRRGYKYTIIIFEKVNEQWIDTGRDKAIEYKFGNLGTRILYWRKRKVYTIFPSERILQNKFYFKRNEFTGEYLPIKIKDSPGSSDFELEDKLRSKMQTYNIGIRKGLEDEFKGKTSWIKDNAVMLISITFIIILGVLGWLILDKVLAISGNLKDFTQELSILTGKLNDLTARINILEQGGTGISPA